jgi:hypothetical protein
MRSKADRRNALTRAKRKASEITDRFRMWVGGPLTDEERAKRVGKMAAVHCKPCSCPGCGNARRHFGSKTLQEEAFLQDLREVP